MQSKYDQIAARHAEELKQVTIIKYFFAIICHYFFQKEEELRKQKIEDWESHLRGGSSKDTKDRVRSFVSHLLF